MKKISFIIPTRDNLQYLIWAYNSIRKNQATDHEVCVAIDNCSDGTLEWCKTTSENDINFKFINNDSGKRLGHTILYDKLINEVATNEIVMIFHSDMYFCPGLDAEIDKYIQPKTIISATRIEPSLHPAGLEKIQLDCGIEPNTFDETELLTQINRFKTLNGNKTTNGIFAPWAIYKSDFQEMGGHDKFYAPQSKEDSDIFNRFKLAGFIFLQTWKGYVYHLTCRGSRFNPTLTKIGTNSTEWDIQNMKSSRNFIRKWGSFVKHDEYLHPVIPNKYQIMFKIKNCTPNILHDLEPFCSQILVDLSQKEIDKYIEYEQPNTLYDLKRKINPYESVLTSDIIVEINAHELNELNSRFISIIPEIIENSGEIGVFNLEGFKVIINNMNTYQDKLIYCDNLNNNLRYDF